VHLKNKRGNVVETIWFAKSSGLHVKSVKDMGLASFGQSLDLFVNELTVLTAEGQIN